MLAGITYGSVRVPLADVWAALAGEHSGGGRFIVWELRLPRVLLAALVGVNLALAGALLQSLTRNALAEPHLLGISAGAGLAAVLALKLDPGTPFTRLPVLAFGGSLLGAALVYGLAWRGGVAPLRLVLAGVAVGALLTAFTTGLLLTSSLTIQTTMSWLAGGLAARTWTHLYALLPYSVVGAALTLLLSRTLDVLALGDEPAAALGVRVQWLRLGLTGIVALLTGSAVAVAGLVGFVGLIVPHIARMLVGSRHGYLLPVSALLGGSLLVAADAVARTIAAPRELPLGIVTAVAGAPFFLYLLRRAA
jgi:iron complex transport system permease protein